MICMRRLASVTAILALLSAAGTVRGAEEATAAYGKDGPGSRPVPTDMRLAERKPIEEPKPADWYAPLKDIPLGPGALDIDFQFRTRYEHYDGYHFPRYNGDENDDLLLLRTWLGFDYKFSEDAHAYVMFQDSRSYLSSLRRDTYAVTSPFFDQADVRRAYVEWKHIGGSPFGFKIGRQAWAYGGRRLLGPSNWGNVGGFWWDAAKMYIDTEPVQVDLFFGQRVVREQIRWNNRHFDYDAMGAWAHFKQLPCTFDLFYILRYDDHGTTRGERGIGDTRRHTVGMYTKGTFARNWDWQGTLAAQFGVQGEDDVEAYAANARLGYTWLDCPWKPRVAGEFSYASGDRDPADGDNNTFDNLYTSPTITYGRMNLFSWQNLMDYQATFEVKPLKKLKVWFDYHYFTLASETDAWYWFNMRPQRRDRTGGSGRELGHEFDIQFKWACSKNLDLWFGYSYFVAGNYLKNTAGGEDDASWGFFQFVYKF